MGNGDASVAVDGVEGRDRAVKTRVLARAKATKSEGASGRGRAAYAVTAEAARVRRGVRNAAYADGDREVTANANAEGVSLSLG